MNDFDNAVRFIRVGDHRLSVPKRATSGAAGIDMQSNKQVIIYPGQQLIIPTGWAWDMANWYGIYGRLAPRSGLAARHGIAVQAGVIDADYQGEIQVILINHGERAFEIMPGDRICQLIIEQCKMSECYEGDEFMSNSHRGEGKFGSTGK